MRHHVFEENSSYKVALLNKGSAFDKQQLLNNYVTPLMMAGVSNKDVIAFTLDYNEVGKAPTQHIKEYLSKLLPALDSLGVKYLLCTDAAYFKVLAGKGKADPFAGYAIQCVVPGFEHMEVVLSLNYQQLIYNPDLQAKLDLSIKTLVSHIQGTYQMLGSGIIHSASYPEGVQEVARALERLHQYPRLAADIEGFSLRFNECGIGTIAFAWDQHNGVAFPVDWKENPDKGNTLQLHGFQKPNPEVRALLKKFFQEYQGKIVWHNAAFDVKVLIFVLWMSDLLDTEGLLTGLEVMTKSWDDTKIIAYLATNSCAGNHLGLKHLAHEFAGNWAVEEIKDIRKIPKAKLLQYNLVDALSTNYVYDKHHPVMVADQQEALYEGLMKDSQQLLIQTELTGMPLSREKVADARQKLEAIQAEHMKVIHGNGIIQMLNLLIRDTAWEKDYEDRKAKAKNPGKILPKNKSVFDTVEFNPNSGPQLQRLLYEQMGLPVLDKTDTGLPATGAETLEKLVNHTTVPEYKELILALMGYSEAGKILSTFIPAFEAAIEKGDGWFYLHGSFNLGGTKSGRLSSSDPNLQNIPANSKYAKIIKECFVAPLGWLFCGADFNSLEDMISALTTKDPNKLKVYTDGFDGHALRACSYFKDDHPDFAKIDPNDPKQVNALKDDKHPLNSFRQDSKAPTFLLTYGGTFHGMMKNLGWSKEKSQGVEANYRQLYVVSDQYVQGRLQQASKDGYVTVAFGLRLRTPLLGQVIFGNRKTPYEAAAEGRTAGNALGQSYGLLNNRAAAAFMKKVRASKYRLDIKIVALIHDAIYLLIRDDVEVVRWVNENLIKEMQWQDLPELYHPTVKLGAALDIFWPSWANKTTLPNGADQVSIINICKAAREKVLEAA